MARRTRVRLDIPIELLTAYVKREIRLSDIADRFGIGVLTAGRELRRNAEEKGVPLPRRGGPRIRLKLSRSLLRRYASGRLTVADIAKRHGIALSTAFREIREACAEHNLAMRPRGGGRKVIPLPAVLLDRFRAGEIGVDEVARRLGVGRVNAWRLLREAGVILSPRVRQSWRADRSQMLKELSGQLPGPPGPDLRPHQIRDQIALMRAEIKRLPRRPGRRGPRGRSAEGAGTILRVFALRLRWCRVAVGLTLCELAADCGINERTLRRLEQGRHVPSRETLAKLLRRLRQRHS